MIYYPDGFIEAIIKGAHHFSVSKNRTVQMSNMLEHDTIFKKPQNMFRNTDMDQIYTGMLLKSCYW